MVRLQLRTKKSCFFCWDLESGDSDAVPVGPESPVWRSGQSDVASVGGRFWLVDYQLTGWGHCWQKNSGLQAVRLTSDLSQLGCNYNRSWLWTFGSQPKVKTMRRKAQGSQTWRVEWNESGFDCELKRNTGMVSDDVYAIIVIQVGWKSNLHPPPP